MAANNEETVKECIERWRAEDAKVRKEIMVSRKRAINFIYFAGLFGFVSGIVFTVISLRLWGWL